MCLKHLYPLAFFLLCACTSFNPNEVHRPWMDRYLYGSSIQIEIEEIRESEGIRVRLKNVAEGPLNIRISPEVFSGELWLIQAGNVPIKAREYDFYELLVHAPVAFPELEIRSGDAIEYDLTLKDMIIVDGAEGLSTGKPLLVFVTMEHLGLRSNVLNLGKYQ